MLRCNALWRKGLQQVSNVTLLTALAPPPLKPARIPCSCEFEHGSGSMQRTARARLAVIADGGATSQRLTRVQVRDYGQSALVANVLSVETAPERAFERFTPEGPLALLPRMRDSPGVDERTRTARLLCSLARPCFSSDCKRHSVSVRALSLRVEGRAAFPLALRVAEPPTAARTLLLGNAAQTLHPVAGQGLNLGLRDAWELAEIFSCNE